MIQTSLEEFAKVNSSLDMSMWQLEFEGHWEEDEEESKGEREQLKEDEALKPVRW